MNDLVSYYTKYKEYIPEYERWDNSNTIKKVIASTPFVSRPNNDSLKQKANIIMDPLLLQDSYEHEKAEDAETFYQTFNMELMSIAGLISTLPTAITKIIPFLKKHAKDGNFAQKASALLEKYRDTTIQIASKNVPISKPLTVISTIIGMTFFSAGIKKSMEAQLGLIRKASFDSTQNIINDPKLFAKLTQKQENEVNNIVNFENKNNSSFVNVLQDKINLSSTFSSVKEFKTTFNNYKKEKEEYFNDIDKVSDKRIFKPQLDEAKEDKVLFENLLKNVEYKVLEPLRRVETISNIAYSSIFTGGFLEYLLTDKLVQVLGVKNKIAATGIKIGAPLITYLLLNKNISDIENKAILATKYKHLKQFTENPLGYGTKEEEKQNLPEFLKTVYKDMKDYDKFSKEEMPKIKQKLEAKRQLNLSEKQMRDAKNLQRNTAMVINKHREQVYDKTVGIKAFSESILGPIDIVSTALGAFIGNKLALKSGNPKYRRLFTGLGAIVAFIPAAIIEAKLTKQQKLAEKIAAMKTIKDLQNPMLFINKEEDSQQNIKIPENYSKTFKDFGKN